MESQLTSYNKVIVVLICAEQLTLVTVNTSLGMCHGARSLEVFEF